MESPSHLRYTKEHEWIAVEGDVAAIGITDHAQHQLGDIVFLELPAEGDDVEKGKAFAVVESVKAVSDIYAPVSGTIVGVNSPLTETPEVLNQTPYGEGWLVRIRMSDPVELEGLLSASDYAAFVKEESG